VAPVWGEAGRNSPDGAGGTTFPRLSPARHFTDEGARDDHDATRLRRAARTLAFASVVLATAACGSKQRQRLAAYDFAGSSVAVVHFHAPDRPTW
jgi:hypothetical protein